jgi:uncharacterized protein
MKRHLMLLPSLACPASCAYCFGPHAGGSPMSRATLEAVVRWQAVFEDKAALDITFHGGEPLVPGIDFYREALPLLREGLAPRRISFGVQSNLWLLTDELCELCQAYDVSLGTSLDGPEDINDAQRGAGYFRRTMAGIKRARDHGLHVGCICTFTAQSAPRAAEVFDFFVQAGLDFSIHAALPPLGHSANEWTLSPEAHGQLLVEMLDRYLDNVSKIRIGTLDAMSRSISAGRGAICTFGDCLGEYLAVDPAGWIYSCQRFSGIEKYRLGNVRDCPTPDDLAAAPFWRVLQERQERIAEACGDCPQLDFCRGGCPYNALVAHGDNFAASLRDPHCPAYQKAFSVITDRALEEVFSEENMNAVVEGGSSKYGLMRKGRLLHLMRGGPHPRETARHAREIVAAAALGVSNSPAEALDKLDRAGVITQPAVALQSLTTLRTRLDTQSQQGLLNAYLHVTYNCNLHCTHCYAHAGPGVQSALAVAEVERLVYQAAAAGFRKAVITGGEPLLHPHRDALLDTLAGVREAVKPLHIVLRTNLAYLLSPALLARIACSADQIVVSVDGDQHSHDARRGAGTYTRTVANLKTLVNFKDRSKLHLTLAATLTVTQMNGPESDAVRALADELGVGARFKAVLPLGRGVQIALTPTYYSSLDVDAADRVAGARPAATCGLGMNLYIAPDGVCYPCYALMGARHALGNACTQGLDKIVHTKEFLALRKVTVDTTPHCQNCAWRYLCGGYCRAWRVGEDINTPPRNCITLRARARHTLQDALQVLDVSIHQWRAAKLP